MFATIDQHWPEYVIEGVLLATFMLSACVCVYALEHPGSPLSKRGGPPWVRRALVGVMMGLTAIALIYSPWGARSGAHMNPGTTLTFLVLGKIRPLDAACYVAAQFVGGVCGVVVARLLLGRGKIGHARVNYVVTAPGTFGVRGAWIGEFAIAFLLMSVVLTSSNCAATSAYTGVFAGLLVATFIAVESPYSGMSMNPARTLGSAIGARAFRGLWIYFTAPPLAMLLAAWTYVSLEGRSHVYCAKLNHLGHAECIFECHIDRMRRATPHTLGGIEPSGASAVLGTAAK